ncbi:D-alanyl-D-alanine carboxypeptidase [Streptomyces sp. NPDC006622]|uniref:D-alanyl-D-alanine carboxypeptidase n=1 Tax=Streptomyces sp. NPDC006622 TaxID=3155459 RepID=UPI0033B99C00
MAGESPDRSKQRESSAEPTSGSAGAVPEARDPRLAVTRDGDSASTTSSAASRGGVDTATRVFSVRELTAEEPDGESGDQPDEERDEGSAGEARDTAGRPANGSAGSEKAAEGSKGSEGSKGPEGPQEAAEGSPVAAEASDDAEGAGTAADGATGGDDRLRTAVAQWVASADEESDEAELEKGSGTSEEGTDAADASPSADGADSAGERSSKPAPRWATGGGTTPEAATDRSDTAAVTGPADKAPSTAATAPSGESGESGDGDDAVRPDAASAGRDDVPESRTGGKAARSAETPAATATAKTKTKTKTKTKAEDPRLGTAKAAPAAAPTPETDAETDADAEAGSARAEADAPAAPEETDKPKAEAADKPGADDEPGAPVDQPTAVFKALRSPAGRGVDQPTTMLKLGDVPKAGKPGTTDRDTTDPDTVDPDTTDPDAKPTPADAKPQADTKTPDAKPHPEAKPAAADAKTRTDTKPAAPDTKPQADAKAAPADTRSEPEPPAERTSRFVALKPLDDAARPAAESTAVVPQIGPERTTQQPLPPKPPLDLLAELTNTPPPPPTPLRTLGRRVKIWTPLVLLLIVVFAIVQAVRPLPATALTLTAQDSYTFEGGKLALPWPSEGQGWMDVDGTGVMGSVGDQKPVAIGSVAKTMTAYVVLKSHALKAGEDGPGITVDAIAEKEGGYNQSGESTLNTVKAGDKLTLQQALSAIMIPSANNIARLLARWDAGSEAAFVEKMNAAAKELGMTNTTYTDPSGLKETTVSTAEDQVKLGNAVVKIPALVAITSAASWTDPSGYNWPNYNELPYHMGAIGIKTGSTSAAGGNLLFAARKKVGGETVTIVGAILGQHKPTILKTVNEVSETALTAAQDALVPAKILKKGDVVGYVDDKLGGRTPVVVTEDVSAVGWAGLTVKLSFAGGEVPHTAKAGTQVGTLTVGDGSGDAVKVPVSLQRELAEPGFSDKLTRIG